MISKISPFNSSLSTSLVAKPIERLLYHEKNTISDFFCREILTRVTAASLPIFLTFDAIATFFSGVFLAPLAFLQEKGWVSLNESINYDLIKKCFQASASYFVLCLLSPLEVIRPDSISYHLLPKKKEHSLMVNDVTRLNPTMVSGVFAPSSVDHLQAILQMARNTQKKVCIGGAKHSQGGQQFYPDSIYIDMRNMNKILQLDLDNKRITVQAGATWEDIQNYINPYDLAVRVMQASNIFTIGGSLSANVHGRDARFGPLVETVRKMHILMADGTLREASREVNPEIFRAAIGGYGLCGIILDVELDLMDNEIYEKSAEIMSVREYKNYFLQNVHNNPNMGLHWARFPISKDHLFDKVLAVNLTKTSKEAPSKRIEEEKNIFRNQILLHLHRRFENFRKVRWDIERLHESKKKILTRNQAMRPEVHCLEYDHPKDTDILQEYFVPVEHFEAFTEKLKEIVVKHGISLQNVTVRFVKRNEDSLLSFSRSDVFAFVLYINQKTAKEEIEKAKIWTQEITNAALSFQGNYYLPYQPYAAKQQFSYAYPNEQTFKLWKDHFDPEHLFYSRFFENYWSFQDVNVRMPSLNYV